ncbi:MAG: sulfate transporter CysZ [Magnetococcales bacterium]|nr:sulfate transporter CysZ [Magnetococcales bacterium]
MISFAEGIGCLVQGMGLIFRPGARRFVLIPLFVNVLLFSLLVGYGLGWVDDLLIWMDGVLPDWLHWLRWLVVPLLLVGVVLFVFSTFTMVANLIASPFNSHLAAVVEGIVAGGRPVARDPGGAIVNEIGKVFYSLKWMFLFLILFLIPGLQAAITPLWLLFCVWMMAVEYGDYPMAIHGMSGTAVRRHLRRHLGGSLGFGVAVMGLMMVPVVNLLAMPAAVAGATVFWLKTRGDIVLDAPEINH